MSSPQSAYVWGIDSDEIVYPMDLDANARAHLRHLVYEVFYDRDEPAFDVTTKLWGFSFAPAGIGGGAADLAPYWRELQQAQQRWVRFVMDVEPYGVVLPPPEILLILLEK